ncbi:hypothetical protein FHR99_000065 [Litorivivens lipolytica]|uniref:START domain-containing protein n=1 Tax=Litorivivens lipolytica TaxID=1524264 RepID=A0A7W4Z3V3_9GAMM|nr:START domain-containing protein [Litorivivens lipolytica]MBB3045829.1 hypothetical protein [Litorivivens lipolytica]
MKFTALIYILLLSLQVPGVNADETAWRLEKDSDGIRIETRPVEGSAYREIRATTSIAGRVSSIVELLQDMSYWPKLNKIISSAELHQQLSESESQLYFQMDMPWPVTDRDVLYHRTIRQDESDHSVTLTDRALTGILPEKNGKVRVVESVQQWTLSPNNRGGVDVTWITHTDPNGPLPAKMVNWLSVGPPHESISVLRTAIEAGEFSDAEPSYVVEP